MTSDKTPTKRVGVGRMLLRGRLTAASAAYVVVVALSGLLGAAVSPYAAGAVDPGRRLQGPSREHWLGTDDLGRDVLTRALYGARVSLLVGGIVTLLTATAGTILGLVAAYYPRLDGPLMRVMDGLMAFPSVLLAIGIMASIGPSTTNVVLALAVVYTAPVARLARGAALVTTHLPYVESARMLGAADGRVLGWHILPNILTPVVV